MAAQNGNSQAIEGMTVNERLIHFKLVDAFDEAILSNDKDAACSVLVRAKFSLQQAESTVTAILENPSLYGYSTSK